VEMGPFSSWQQAWGVAQTLEGRGVVAAVRWEAPGRWWVWAWAPPPVTGAPSLDATAAVTKADPSLAAAYPPKLAFAGPLLAVWTGSSPLILAPALVAASGGCALKLAAPGVGPGPYAGALLLWPQRAPGDPSAGVGVANAVPLERYVADVLPCEMPASWPWAALQAQAIAIRTYALWAMNTRPPQSPWILSAGTEDQVYGGLGVETAVTNEAAWSTAGEVVTYQGSPIDALYEPDSGGHTASSAHVWGYALPYLVGVPEPPGYRPQRWVVHLTPAQVEARVRGATGTDVGQVLDLKVGSVGASGRVLALQVEGTLGTARLTLDQVRTALGLPSSHMRPSSNAQAWIRGASARIPVPFLAGRQAQGALSQRSIPTWGRVWVEGAQIATSLPTLPTLFTFAGAGLGPGLGMTQDGAFLLAQEGATPARILFYYYKGVTLSMWPGDVPPASRQGIP
jgi:stage II sporulation protein D